MNDQQSKGSPMPANDDRKTSGFGTPSTPAENLPAAEVIATEAGQQIARAYGHLDRRGRMRLVSTFRRQLIPPRKPGRKRRQEITAAHADWKSGMRGEELYRKHIAGYDRMSRWRRKSESRDLRDAIRSRERRAPKREDSDSGSSSRDGLSVGGHFDV
jgi:hypothetical protein